VWVNRPYYRALQKDQVSIKNKTRLLEHQWYSFGENDPTIYTVVAQVKTKRNDEKYDITCIL